MPTSNVIKVVDDVNKLKQNISAVCEKISKGATIIF